MISKFKRAVLAFHEAQLRINQARQEAHDFHATTLAALGRRLDTAERRINELERRVS